MYVYRGEVIRVVDGDTVDIKIDLGFRIHHTIRARLYDIDAPELRTPEGSAARNWLIDAVVGCPLAVHTIRDSKDKYGRYLVILHRDDIVGSSINSQMIEAGHAVRYE